jgi:eukaryotic-like serine/threonine-protein kinase
MNNLIGTQIDHYRIDLLLGEGGMGAVYRAYDLNLARPVALKVMHQHLANRQEFKARFMQEAQSAAGLIHPSVVTVHYFGPSQSLPRQGLLFMVMAYIPGGSLNAHLRQLRQKGQVVQLREVLIFLAQVADALGYAHRQGVVHRDIKPSNVLVQRVESPESELPLRAVVTDFGLAKLMTGGFDTKTDTPLGTYPYMSPEQFLQKPVDGRSDIYSLGVMLYELTTGKYPLDIKSVTDAVLKHQANEKPLPPREAWPGLPIQVEAIINKAIARKPEDRFQTGEAFASRLRDAAKTLADSDVTQFESQHTVKSLGTRLESIESKAEPSRMGFDLPLTSPGDRLIIAQKDHTPRAIPLNKVQLTIGRTKDNDILLDHEDISRHHARLDQLSTGWQVTDLGSTNSTYLDGNKLLADIPEDFPPGKTLRLGPYFLHWQRAEERSASRSVASRPSRVLRSRVTSFQSKTGQIGVDIQPAKLEIIPGGHAQVKVEIFNQGDLVDHYNLEVLGLPRNWVGVNDTRSELMPGTSATLTFDIHPPLDASAREGLHNYKVVVRSASRSGESVTVPGELIVKPFERFSAELHPSQLSHGGITQITIHNEGNAERTYSLAGKDPANAIEFAGVPSGIRVPSGQSAVQQVQVMARERPLVGSQRSLPFQIEVRSASQVAQSLLGQLNVTPLVPAWILPLFGFLCTICLIGAAMFLWPGPDPQVTPSPTAPLTVAASIPPASTGTSPPTETPTLTPTESSTPSSTMTPTNSPTSTPTPRPPNPPINLRIISGDCTGTSIGILYRRYVWSWQDIADNETGYRVILQTEDNFGQGLTIDEILPANATTYSQIDQNVGPLTLYVQAFNSGGTSASIFITATCNP